MKLEIRYNRATITSAGVRFDQFPNQLRTLLIERPDTFQNENVYNYLFAEGIGLLAEWTISRQKDNTGSGWMRQIGPIGS